MSDEEPKVPEELFKDVKFYVVGDIDQKVVQLLKAGKGKEVSYNALATHIIAEDGDNPEVGESREVFDLPVVKPSWVTLSVRCGDLLPVTGFSPESGQIFFGVTACLPKLPDDLNTLWALITFYGGDCQLNLNKKCTHLIVPEPKGEKYEVALKHSSIKIVTPEWITNSALDKSRKDEALYHPRLTYQEVEEDEESEYESLSEGSYSPPGPRSRRSSSSSREDSPASGRGGTSPKAQRRDELMFDDSDDSSTEKEERNLNWTPVEITGPTPGPKRRLQPGKDSGLINLCASVPPVPGSAGPPDARATLGPSGAQPGAERPEGMAGWSPAARTLRNITNNSDIQQTTRPSNVAHILQSLSAATKTLEQQQQTNQGQPNVQPNPLLFNQAKPQGQQQLTAEAQQQLLQQQSHQVPQQPQQQPQQQHPPQQLPQQQHPMLQHPPPQQLMQLHQQQVPQHGFPPQLPQQQAHQFIQQQQKQPQQQQIHQQQIFTQPQQQQPPHAFSQQQLRPQQLPRPPIQQQHALQQQLQQHRLQLQLQQNQQQQQQQQLHQQHLQQQQHFLQQQMQQQDMQQLQQQQQHLQSQQQSLQQHPSQQPQQQQQGSLQPQLQPPQVHQLFGHEPGQEIPEDGFLVGCVFAIADYQEQMADKQLLATWKRIIQAYGGIVDSSLNNRCTHLLCETQVSSMYVQALREGRRCVTAHWLNTILKKKKMVPPHRTLHLPFAFPPGAKPCSQHIISVTGFVDSDRDDLKLMAYLTGARYTGYLCRSNTVLICKEPSGLKYEKAKEWRIPCVNAQWLCDILLGNFEVLRQVQHSRYSNFNLQEPLIPNQHLVQNLLGAWRAPVKVSPGALAALQMQQKQKRSESNSLHPNKKPRLEEIEAPTKKLPPESTPYIFFTGFEPTQVQQFMKRLHNLGGEIAESAQKCTHLVANKVTRTVKFLTAMSIVKHIITPEWLEESWKSKKFVDEQNYMLRDAEAEVLFGFSLEESLKRAHTAPLFKGKYFYITPGICPSLTTMKAIIESAGGKVLPKQPSFRKIMEHKQNKYLPEIILISCENDLHLCRDYFLKNIDIHNAEFILTGVLTQNLDYESNKFT
ncbi:PAX-interacting protein 1 [Coregonus clupeaformis]|uniref:PAX-interacting protein 1 n=1 Tax=Coregonus clupeaformis TaxID=59861 RepID=UPI001BDFDA1A|nr:PAX-interacting protein 1 [Coregonus clupeaformis]